MVTMCSLTILFSLYLMQQSTYNLNRTVSDNVMEFWDISDFLTVNFPFQILVVLLRIVIVRLALADDKIKFYSICAVTRDCLFPLIIKRCLYNRPKGFHFTKYTLQKDSLKAKKNKTKKKRHKKEIVESVWLSLFVWSVMQCYKNKRKKKQPLSSYTFWHYAHIYTISRYSIKEGCSKCWYYDGY